MFNPQEYKVRIAGGASVRTKSLKVEEWSFEKFASFFRRPGAANEKDGNYYIRGGELSAPERGDENLLKADLVVLDADGESFEGHDLPKPEQVHNTLSQNQIPHFIYTTYSSTVERPRFRVVVPAKMNNARELQACVSEILKTLHDNGVWVRDVPENYRWSQPWYFPRVPEGDAPYTYLFNLSGKEIDVPKVSALYAEAQEENRVVVEARVTALRHYTPDEAIQWFNQTKGREWICSTLEHYGYEAVEVGPRETRYRRPGSKSEPGVVLLPGKYGDLCLYSFHGEEDPLSASKVRGGMIDAYGVFVRLVHGDNARAAREELEDLYHTKVLRPTKLLTYKGVTSPDLEEYNPSWLVKHLIPDGAYVVMYGQPSSYKSFLAFYLAARVATGENAFNQATAEGEVLFIAAEGALGTHLRDRAYQEYYEPPAMHNLKYLLGVSLDFRTKADDVDLLVEAQKEDDFCPRLIVVDTLSCTFGAGDQNTTDGMQAYVNMTMRLKNAFGDKTSIVIIHHAGKSDAQGLRGSSVLGAAADTIIKVAREDVDDEVSMLPTLQDLEFEANKSTQATGGGDGRLVIEKQRQGARGRALYTLRPVVVSTGKSSLVVVDRDEVSQQSDLIGESQAAYVQSRRR